MLGLVGFGDTITEASKTCFFAMRPISLNKLEEFVFSFLKQILDAEEDHFISTSIEFDDDSAESQAKMSIGKDLFLGSGSIKNLAQPLSYCENYVIFR